jgi:hypothetical protein
MIPDEIFLKIVRNAVKAPSGHNTQPWLFAKEDDGLSIIPDFSRSLPVADAENRELFISLGCAAETAMIAARFYGYKAELNLDLLETKSSIRMILTKHDNSEQPELFSFINFRQTTRKPCDNKLIPRQDLEMLKATASKEGVNIRYYIGQNEMQQFSPFISEAIRIQMNNPKFRSELIKWMRFSEKEAIQKGDGLYSACSGVPSMGRMLGSFVLKNFVTAKSENQRMLKQLEKTATVALFTSPNNSFGDWIKTGMVFQRFALTATKLNLSHSHLNSPCQIPEVRNKMKSALGLKGEFSQLIICLGYSQKTHFSFRRRINDTIL